MSNIKSKLADACTTSFAAAGAAAEEYPERCEGYPSAAHLEAAAAADAAAAAFANELAAAAAYAGAYAGAAELAAAKRA